MKKSSHVIVFITLIICVVFTSCRKLPPLPENYDTLFATPKGFDEIVIPCENDLTDNELFTDISINGFNEFNVTESSSYYSNDRYSIEVTDEIRKVSIELNFHKASNDEIEFSNKYLASSSYTDSIHLATVKLSSTYNNYYTRSYNMIEDQYIYVKYTKSDVIISLCELKFMPTSGLQDVITLSGRIKYEK